MKKYSTFFRENYSFVVGVAERRLDSIQDAEEVATEAFHLAWQRYEAGDPLSVPWLYGVVRNLIGNEYRRRGRRTELQRQLNEDFAISVPRSDELHADVRDAVEGLPQIHREVLKMTYWERLTAREIAAVLGINSATVRARLMRARRLLRTALNDTPVHVEREAAGRE